MKAVNAPKNDQVRKVRREKRTKQAQKDLQEATGRRCEGGESGGVKEGGKDA